MIYQFNCDKSKFERSITSFKFRYNDNIESISKPTATYDAIKYLVSILPQKFKEKLDIPIEFIKILCQLGGKKLSYLYPIFNLSEQNLISILEDSRVSKQDKKLIVTRYVSPKISRQWRKLKIHQAYTLFYALLVDPEDMNIEEICESVKVLLEKHTFDRIKKSKQLMEYLLNSQSSQLYDAVKYFANIMLIGINPQRNYLTNCKKIQIFLE